MASISPSNALSLSDKCCICYGTPKYCCPRCSARTCSLTCSKTHKARALCSGVRNPAEYMKRNEIATPQAFDRDFNFLSGLETKIGGARREAKGRGVDFETGGTRNGKGERHKGPLETRDPLERIFAERGVVVKRAPKGMSRREENETSWFKKRRLLRWMVEWHFLGRRPRSIVYENTTIAEAHDGVIFELLQGEKSSGDAPTIKEYVSAAGAQLPEDVPGRKALAKELGPLDRNKNRRQFYLHLPERSNSQRQFIVPVDGQSKLCDILRGQTIWEFPTILVAVPVLDDLDRRAYEIGPPILAVFIGEADKTTDQGSVLGKRKAQGFDQGSAEEKLRSKAPVLANSKPEGTTHG